MQLKYVEQSLSRRREIEARYRAGFADTPGISMLPDISELDGNSSYMPIFISNEYPLSRDELYQKMKDAGINCRRYFYPLISDMPMYRGLPSADAGKLVVARGIAESVLCLPIYPGLENEHVDDVIGVVVEQS